MKKKVYHITAHLVNHKEVKKTETVVAKTKVKAIESFTEYNRGMWNVIECKEMNLDEEFGIC